MPEYQLPVNEPGFRGDLGLNMDVLPDRSVIELSTWPSLDHLLAEKVASLRDSGQTLLHVAPQRYWLLGDADVSSNDINEMDISHRLCLMRVIGAQARNVLSKGAPIDIHVDEFPAGALATTAIDGITVTIHNTGDSFDLYCNRSYADSLWCWLTDAASEFA